MAAGPFFIVVSQTHFLKIQCLLIGVVHMVGKFYVQQPVFFIGWFFFGEIEQEFLIGLVMQHLNFGLPLIAVYAEPFGIGNFQRFILLRDRLLGIVPQQNAVLLKKAFY